MAHQKVRWMSEMEDQLVDLWQHCECLYNVSCKEYHNRNDKERNWAEIAAALEIPVEEVKTRATTLRTQFSKLLKSKPSGASEKPLTSKQRWLMKTLMFLRKHVTQRATESSLPQSIKDGLSAERDPLSDPDDDVSLMSDETSAAEEPSIIQNDDDLSPPVPPIPTAKRLKKSQSAEAIKIEKFKILQQMSTAFKAGKSKPIADSDSNFGAQVAEELRSIKNPVVKTRLKRKIMNDLYEAQENEVQASYQLPPSIYPVPSSVHIPNTHPTPLHTYTTPQEPPHHMPLPIGTQLLQNPYQLQNNETHSYRRMLEDNE
nr:uncharacterized protein LOC129434331 [Misgurnus anguillicaudatus]